MKYIYYDYTNQRLVNSTGAQQPGVYPSLTYQELASWQIQLYDLSSGTPVPLNVSAATAWEVALDYSYDLLTPPMVYTTNSNIDHSQAATGIITATLDADTSTFLSTLVAKNPNPTIGLQTFVNLKGYNALGRVQFLVGFIVNTFGMVYPSGSTPPDPSSNYYDKGEVDGIVAGLQPIATLPAAVQAALSGAFTFDATTGKLTAINWLDSSNNPHTMTMNADGSLHTNP